MKRFVMLFIAIVLAMLIPDISAAVERLPNKVAAPVLVKKDVAGSQMVSGDVMAWSGH